MCFPLHLLFILVVVIFHKHEAMGGPYTTIVSPVTKHTDAAIPLYSVQLRSYGSPNKNFIIDIDAPFMWYDCIMQLDPHTCPSDTYCTSPVACDEYQCSDIRTLYSYTSPSCPPDRQTNNPVLRGPNGYTFCTCPVNVVNPVTGSCSQAPLNYNDFTVSKSDGRNVLTSDDYLFPTAACAPPSTFASFPANVSGVMAFSSSLYGFPGLYYLKRAFALCFPSNPSANGVMLYGTGPFYLLPQSNVDVTSYLSYTPLLKHQESFGYFITVNNITIKKRSINVPTNATTKLSTIDPYTTLRTDIYNGVVRRFSLVTKRLPPAKPVAPFSLCFSTSTTGLRVPDIDFNLPDGKKWTVSTTNSIKQVTNDVACLAFVDGGATSEPAIVIGTFQFQDNFLVFDIEGSTLGFSSSLLRRKTSCSNFNFTLTH